MKALSSWNRVKTLGGKANGFKDLLENYFPRMWNLDAITKYSDHFKAIIYNYYKNNPVIYVNGKKINLSTEKVYIASQLCMSTLAVGFTEENLISPRFVTESKKAVNAYLATN